MNSSQWDRNLAAGILDVFGIIVLVLAGIELATTRGPIPGMLHVMMWTGIAGVIGAIAIRFFPRRIIGVLALTTLTFVFALPAHAADLTDPAHQKNLIVGFLILMSGAICLGLLIGIGIIVRSCRKEDKPKTS